MNPSTITRPRPARPPLWAWFQAFSTSDALRTTDWPLPEELITGLMTQGKPIAFTADAHSASVSANRYGEVGSPSCSAASRRMPSRFMVSRAAQEVGTTL